MQNTCNEKTLKKKTQPKMKRRFLIRIFGAMRSLWVSESLIKICINKFVGEFEILRVSRATLDHKFSYFRNSIPKFLPPIRITIANDSLVHIRDI
jgi:hypothetical protein